MDMIEDYTRCFKFEFLPRIDTLVLSHEGDAGTSTQYQDISSRELDLNRMPSLDCCELRLVTLGRITAFSHRGLSRLLISDCGPAMAEVDVRGCLNLTELDVDSPSCLVRTEGSAMLTGGSSRGPRADGCSSAMNKPGESGAKRLPGQRTLEFAPATRGAPTAGAINARLPEAIAALTAALNAGAQGAGGDAGGTSPGSIIVNGVRLPTAAAQALRNALTQIALARHSRT